MEIMNEKLEMEYAKEIRQPFIDSLTGIFTQELFEVFLDHEITRTRRYAIPFTLAVIEIDSFSSYHQVSENVRNERLFQKVAEGIQLNIRQADILTHYADNRFAVILETITAEAALIPVKALKHGIEQAVDVPLSIRIGLVSFPQDAATKGDFLDKAEEALQRSKIRGGEPIYFFEHGEQPSCDEEQPTVLIIDDDLRNLKLLEALLLPLSVKVIKATNGHEALLGLHEAPVDLVLSDVMMPEMDGFEVCRRIKMDDTTRMIPVILVTSLDDTESKVEGIKCGADDFISKPPNYQELRARTSSLLRLRRLNSNLTSVESVLFSLAKSIEAKDQNTQGHIERVAQLAENLGKKMGLSANTLRSLHFGAALHDIGKLGVPGSILNKSGPLSDEERVIVQRHPAIGYEICLPLENVLGPALDCIRHHHEKLDGNGYPDHLQGGEISLVARIMVVVDIYDALISNRPYREAMPKENVMKILRQEAFEGKLDGEIVEHLIEMVT